MHAQPAALLRPSVASSFLHREPLRGSSTATTPPRRVTPRRHEDAESTAEEEPPRKVSRQHSANSSLFRDGWIDSQLQLNHQVTRIALLQQQAPGVGASDNDDVDIDVDTDGTVDVDRDKDKTVEHGQEDHDTDLDVTEIKVMQTFSERPISLHRLFDTLLATPHHRVETLAFCGIHLDEAYGEKLAQVLLCQQQHQHPHHCHCHRHHQDSSSNPIRSLQLTRLLATGLPSLCRALASTDCAPLQELRLTFRHVDRIDQPALWQAVGQHPTLKILKVYSLDVSQHIPNLQQCLQQSRNLQDIRLTACRLGYSSVSFADRLQRQNELIALAKSISLDSKLTQLDWSMNHVSHPAILSWLLQTKSLQSICLSQNVLSKGTVITRNNKRLIVHGQEQEQQDFLPIGTALAQNTTLKRLFLDMNALEYSFVEALHQALLHDNTTLQRLGLLTVMFGHGHYQNSTKQHALQQHVLHLVALNEAGRGLIHCHHSPTASALLPHLLARVRCEPEVMWGLLRENPSLWIPL